jgi:hypothetical protein
MRRCSFVALATLLAVASASGCKSDSAGPSSIEGDYALETVNGSPPPFTLSNTGGVKEDITDGVLTLKSGGIYTHSFTKRVTQGGVATTRYDQDSGSWSLSGGTFTMTSSFDQIPHTGTRDGSDIAITYDGNTWVYRQLPAVYLRSAGRGTP